MLIKTCWLPVIFVLVMTSCGLTQTAPSGNTANANVAIVMPKGVSVKSAGAGVKSVTATSISVSVTAADIATAITATVPLSALSVSFDVPSGSARTFTVTVVTSGGSYTGSQTVDLAGGASVNLSISVTTSLLGGAIQKQLTLGGVVTTFAGSPAGTLGFTDATGTSALFRWPYGITTDGTNLYVPDTSNHAIRQVVIATGVVTTLAGSAGVAGTTDGTGTAARFYYPYGLTTDGTNLYVADGYNHTIRKVVIATSVVTTLAGSGTAFGTTDGTGTGARFYYPLGLTTDGTNVYVADSYNHAIRQVVIATGVVTTLAGSAAGVAGTTDGTGTAARFHNPGGVTTDGTNLYVADTYNDTIRQVVIATGVVTTLAGIVGVAGSVDGTGTAARFYYPYGLTSDGTSLYVGDSYNQTIRKVVIATGVVTTLAGSAGVAGTTDGTGTGARFSNPNGVTTDGTSLYIADTGNSNIRKIK